MFAENKNGKFKLVIWEQDKWRKKLGQRRYAYLVLFIHRVNGEIKKAWETVAYYSKLCDVRLNRIEDLEKQLTYNLIFHNVEIDNLGFFGFTARYRFGDGEVWQERVNLEDTKAVTRDEMRDLAAKAFMKRRPVLQQTSDDWFVLVSDDIPF